MLLAIGPYGVTLVAFPTWQQNSRILRHTIRLEPCAAFHSAEYLCLFINELRLLKPLVVSPNAFWAKPGIQDPNFVAYGLGRLFELPDQIKFPFV